MKSTNLVIALLLFATALTAKAAPLLNGLALEQQFNKDQYVAAVYSERLSDDANSLLDNNMPRSLQIRVIAERMSARRLRNQWMEGIAINNPGATLTGQAENMVTFANLFKGRLVTGDRLRIDFAADTGTTSVSLNDIMLGMIEDREFFNTLLRAWIGPVPPSTDFRDNLLSAGRTDSGLLATYESLQPAAERVAQIAAMVDEQEGTQEQVAAASEPAKVQPKPAEVAAVATSKPKPDLKADIPAPTLASIGAPPVELPAPAVKTAAKTAQVTQPKPLKPTTTRPAVPAMDEEDELEEDEAPLTADMILARQIYHSMLLRHTFKHLRYPKRAQERGQGGSVRLNVVIDNQGNVKNVTTLQESRYASLNREAIEAVERAAPYPATPAQLKLDEYKFSLPITFKLPD
ncbi:TonB family protein [Microbulbifer sp. CAU 1566]|uniref:TonB family protein n=1 Tax=Microbulbifer sp. CAU 1566 TaxID=2933269 RepID=UPI0020054D31|nr:TonB family protein [Microbulbifer sp. CAU 1566]MCK7598514.1 TonB family protein [Microbulbifer sp. CAU 1566]